MGSFQQISLGAICLGAAFAFGNYVNNNPPTSDHPFDQTSAAENGSDKLSIGNIQSRLADDSFDIINKRPAPIATMRKPLKPRFSVPLTDRPLVNSVAENQLPTVRADEESTPSRLPPPSSLDLEGSPKIETEAQLGIAGTDNRFAGTVREIDVPDFSSIAAEFQNPPIKLPKMGAMPSHSYQSDRSMAVPNPLVPIPNKEPIKDLASQFAAQSPTQPVVPILDSADTYPANPTVNVPRENWQHGFTDNDFSPKLKTRFGNFSSSQTIDGPVNHIKQNQMAIAKRSRDRLRDQGFSYTQPVDPADPGMASLHSAPTFKNAPVQSPAPEVESHDGVWGRVETTPRSRANHVVSKHTMPDEFKPRYIDADQYTNQRTQRVAVAPEPNRVRSILPFGLTEQAKDRLVAIQNDANSRISLETTQFADHVIQNGETLQSISTRYYGKPDYYLDIYLANRAKLRNPADTPAGTALRIPIYE